MSGSSQKQSLPTIQQTQSGPWSEQAPFLKTGFAEAQKLYDAPGPNYFPGSTVSGFNPLQSAAQSAGADRAMTGNPLLPAAQEIGRASCRERV